MEHSLHAIKQINFPQYDIQQKCVVSYIAYEKYGNLTFMATSPSGRVRSRFFENYNPTKAFALILT